MKKGIGIFLGSCLFCQGLFAQSRLCKSLQEAFGVSEAFREKTCKHRTGWLVPSVFREVIELHLNLFLSSDSFKIATSVFPFYVTGRIIDKNVQSCFYDARCHKNCCQLPHWCHNAAKIGIGAPIVALGSLAFFGKSEKIRTIGRVFLVGMPFVIFGKDIIKKWGAEHCLRPKHENFCCRKKYYGGFPSGHMAEITYMTVLFGMRFGPKAAVPLGLLSGFVAGTFINGNRHYFSQIIAGAALGAIYALAANKVIDHELAEKGIKFNFDYAQSGNLTFCLSFHF